jgi:RND family efflux transporter MFP subunit
MKPKLKYILPPLVLVLGVAVMVGMIKSRRPAPRQTVEAPPPLVRTTTIEKRDYRYQITSQGTVSPRTEITLVAEVSGRIISQSPSFEAGGFFDQRDVLLTIDSLDYEASVERARLTLRQAERRLAEEKAQADVAAREWDRLGKGEPSPLTLREPQLAEAKAQIASARKALEQAERDLERTRIRAPFAGRIRQKLVGRGQYVSRGAPVAVIYAVDYAEVRLPLPSQDLAFVDLPLSYRGNPKGQHHPEVELRARIAGRTELWKAHIVRTEGEIDPRTRLIYAVARVEDPYGREQTADRLPLAAGQFVEASIAGHSVRDVVVLSRSALRGTDEVLVVDAEERLRIRKVDVLRAEDQTVVIGSGLEAGERVSLSPIDVVVDGMKVRTTQAGSPTPADTLAGRDTP